MEKAIKKYFPIFALPTAIAFFIFFVAPFVIGVYLSLCKFTTITDAQFVGFENYLKILRMRQCLIHLFIHYGIQLYLL